MPKRRRRTGGREGQALVELAILLTLMAIVLVVALSFLGQRTSSTVGRVGDEFGKAAGGIGQHGRSGNPGGGNNGNDKGVGNSGNGNAGSGQQGNPPGGILTVPIT